MIFLFFTLLLSSLWTSRGHRCRSFSPPVLAFNFHRAKGLIARRFFHRVFANSRYRAFRKSICAQEEFTTNLYEYALGGTPTHNPRHIIVYPVVSFSFFFINKFLERSKAPQVWSLRKKWHGSTKHSRKKTAGLHHSSVGLGISAFCNRFAVGLWICTGRYA